MERIFGSGSDYSEETRNELKKVMRLPEQEKSGISVYGKTGLGVTDGITVDAWFTGFAERTEGNVLFLRTPWEGQTEWMYPARWQRKSP